MMDTELVIIFLCVFAVATSALGFIVGTKLILDARKRREEKKKEVDKT